MAAVAQDADALEYASAELRGDREVALAAVAQAHGALRFALAELKVDPFFVRLKRLTPKQKRWTLLTLRFYVVLFVKKLQRRVEARDHELFEAAWMEHRYELTVGVPECVAKVTFQHGWVAGVSSRKRPRIK